MKSIFTIIIFGIFISCTVNEKDLEINESQHLQFNSLNSPENQNELSIYWINRAYAICIGRGHSPCSCLSENELVMLYLDRIKKKAFIQSSIYYFGMETSAEFDYTLNTNDEIIIKKSYPLQDSMIITIPEKIYIEYNGESIPFEKYVYKNLNKPKTEKAIFSRLSDMWQRRNIFNSTALLAYPKTFSTDSTQLFFNFNELDSLIQNEKVSLSCSDDYQFNSLKIEGKPNRYFHLEFKSDHVVLYDEKEERNKGETLNLNTLDKQIFYRKK
jgi:hypothetical protein